jgi:hypothetical protein
MSTAAAITSNLAFLPTLTGAIAYTLNGKKAGDSWSSIVVAINASTTAQSVALPSSGKWNVVVSGGVAGTKTLSVVNGGKVSVPPQSTVVLQK